jgi:hypothetical protein
MRWLRGGGRKNEQQQGKNAKVAVGFAKVAEVERGGFKGWGGVVDFRATYKLALAGFPWCASAAYCDERLSAC